MLIINSNNKKHHSFMFIIPTKTEVMEVFIQKAKEWS